MEPNVNTQFRQRTGRLISFGIVISAIILGLVVLYRTNYYPRTDDAQVFANFIGIAPRVEGSLVQLNVRDNQFVKKGASCCLEVARDRVLGIMLGLFMIWLVFDQLWGAAAVVEIKKTFVSNIRLLAQFAREPLSAPEAISVKQGIALRETINTNLDNLMALADGILFEFGPSREQDLALRDRIRRWQPQLRVLFITRITLWKYRMRLPGFELPETTSLA